MNDTEQQDTSGRVECGANKEPAVRLFIVGALAIGFALWMVYDHFIKGRYQYPNPYELNKFLSWAFNHYGPFVFIPVGLIFVALGVVAVRRLLVADGKGIGYQGKTKCAWGSITGVDASKLKDKGILTLQIGDDDKLVLDSRKLKGFKDLIAFVEARLPEGVEIGK